MKNLGLFFTLSLLFIFSICCFMLLHIQIQNYEVLQKNTEKAFYMNTPISYVSNKIHSYDATGGVSVILIQDKEVLKLSDDTSDTYLYKYKSELFELCVVKGMEPDLQDGQKLMKCNQFHVEQNGNLVLCKVNGTTFYVQVRSGDSV